MQRGVDPLKTVGQMTEADISAVCEAVCEAARGLLQAEVTALARAFKEMERRQAQSSQAAKFQVCDGGCWRGPGCVEAKRKVGNLE